MKYANSVENISFIRTGTFVDNLLGGIPLGRVGEIFGDESMGKSTLALQIVAHAQREKLKCVWVDIEHSFEPLYAKTLGVDISKLGLIEDEIAEDSLNELEEEALSGAWDIIVLDSIGAMRTRAQSEKGYGEKSIGAQAGLVSNFARNIATAARYRDFALIGINHSFVDIMTGALKTSGGKKWAYHKAWSIRLKSAGKFLKQGEHIVGKVITAEVIKDKVRGNEKKKVDAQLLFQSGFSAEADLIETALGAGVLTKRGGNYFMGDEKVAFGMPKLREWVKSHEEEIRKLL